MAKNWKKEWMKIKGRPWKTEKCSFCLKALYNCFVYTSCFDGNQDVAWFNQQVIVCCNAVLSCMKLEYTADYPAPDEEISCNCVIRVLEHSISKLKKLQNTAILSDMFRCGLSLMVIWSSLNVSASDILQLITVFVADTQLCNKVNPNILFLMEKMLESNFQSKSNAADCVAVKYAEKLSPLHPSLLYLSLVLLYQNQKYQEVLKFSSDYVNDDFTEKSILSCIHNLSACCYVHIGKPLMAIMYCRRAVNCAEEKFFLVPLLYNLHRTYYQCEMIEPAFEMLEILLSILTDQAEKYPAVPLFIFECRTDFPNVKIAPRHSISDPCPVAYYAANHYSQNGKYIEAIKWYKYFLSDIGNEYNPSVSTRSSEYQLPVIPPSVMQITSEYSLALYASGKFEELLNLSAGNNKLSFCSSSFQRAQTVTCSKIYNEEPLTPKDRNTFEVVALQLYHSLAIELYRIGAMLKDDTLSAENIISQCLNVTEYIHPVVRSVKDPSLCTKDCTDEEFKSHVEATLCSLKAMLYFNLALLLSRLRRDDKDILSALQNVLRFDSQNIEVRWSVTMLLWNIGQHEESIKTWCKTRSINYKLPPNQIDILKKAKESELAKSNSITKKKYLEKDISILGELLRIIS